ncbi:MAG: ACP S-malonyltransferase [Desulfobacteraceae bacterium]|jgi:trans-AT polyketide synthase/acyltransferase/oxidoreductase domain-containing protein
MILYVFPGQGSQKLGMGKDLFDKYADLVDRIDEILGYSIKQLCLEGTLDILNNTRYSQPALYVVNCLQYMENENKGGAPPDYLAGHSLGEYSALFASGAFDFETGLKLVRKRGELMSRVKGGGMAAIIGLSPEEITEIIKTSGLKSISIANYNCPSQTVVGGLLEEMKAAEPYFTKAKGMFIPLRVSGAFHTSHMEEARETFRTYVEAFTFSRPKIPVIANVDAKPYKISDLPAKLIAQITSPVRWTDTVAYVMQRGDFTFEEIGPGHVLTGLIEKIRKEVDITEEKNKKLHVGLKKDQKRGGRVRVTPEALGSREFKADYNLQYAYVTGGMYRGIASPKMVVKIAKNGMLAFFGTGGLSIGRIEEAIEYIDGQLKEGEAYGMNLLFGHDEQQLVDLFLKRGIDKIEAAAYLHVTPSLVRYRLADLREENGSVVVKNRIMAKISRPEIAEAFLSPPPKRILTELLSRGEITRAAYELAARIPMADEICVESDSAGHTDMGVAYVLFPSVKRLCEQMKSYYGYEKNVKVGAAGGIGTPEAAAAAFILGADFILTGSINQCTVEAGTSDVVKEMLQQIDVQDTEYAPAGDMFEFGSRVQVMKKGVFFPARANKLYDMYRQYDSLSDIGEKERNQLQKKYFKRSFDDIFENCKKFYPPEEIEKANSNPKVKMAMIFKWYFGYSTRIAMTGDEKQKINFQVHCGPALGAFNRWVKGTKLETWPNRYVDRIAVKLMDETAKLLEERIRRLAGLKPAPGLFNGQLNGQIGQIRAN